MPTAKAQQVEPANDLGGESAPPDSSPKIRTTDSVAFLRAASPSWLIEGLFEEGDQVALFAAPKSGETQLALQIAVAVALGRDFLTWKGVPGGRRTLYVNLQTHPRVFAQAVASHVLNDPLNGRTIHANVDQLIARRLYLTYGTGAVDLLDAEDLRAMRQVIVQCAPDFVVFDAVPHNDPQRLLNAIRALTEPLEKAGRFSAQRRIAHLLVCHSASAHLFSEAGKARPNLIMNFEGVDPTSDAKSLAAQLTMETAGGTVTRLHLKARSWGQFYIPAPAVTSPVAGHRLNLERTKWFSQARSEAQERIYELFLKADSLFLPLQHVHEELRRVVPKYTQKSGSFVLRNLESDNLVRIVEEGEVPEEFWSKKKKKRLRFLTLPDGSALLARLQQPADEQDEPAARRLTLSAGEDQRVAPLRLGPVIEFTAKAAKPPLHLS